MNIKLYLFIWFILSMAAVMVCVYKIYINEDLLLFSIVGIVNSWAVYFTVTEFFKITDHD